jgi:hypothetical protein
VLPFLVDDRVLGIGRGVGRLLGRVGSRVHTDPGEVLRGHASLSDGDARAAFLHTLRTIVDPMGQRVDASDRLYVAQVIPFLIVWGERDPIIPVEHAYTAQRLVPGSRLEDFPDTVVPAQPTPERAASYDGLSVEEVRGHLRTLSPADLAALGEHERANQNRRAIVADIDALLDRELWPGYDGLDVDGVRFGLDGAGPDRISAVMAYERAHQNRAGVVLAAQQRH